MDPPEKRLAGLKEEVKLNNVSVQFTVRFSAFNPHVGKLMMF